MQTTAASLLIALALGCGTSSLHSYRQSPPRTVPSKYPGLTKETRLAAAPRKISACARAANLDRFALGLGELGAIDEEALYPRAREFGVWELRVHAWRGKTASYAAQDHWFESLRQQSDAPLACGLAVHGDHSLWVAVERAVVFSELAEGNQRCFRLAEGFYRPQLLAVDAELMLYELPLHETGDEYCFAIDPVFQSKALLQLHTENPSGGYPVIEFGRTDLKEEIGNSLKVHGGPREQLQTLRSHFNAGALRNNRLLSEQAKQHAEQVCLSHKVSHRGESGEGPEERLGKLRLSADATGEAIARARDTEMAFSSLLSSPSHLKVLLDSRFTDVGMATAHNKKGRTCLVVFFASWPRTRAR
ncbi:MAG: hypothetical protein IPJ88_16090 [Myxococcales bacterium]|nr:MAG: hypothetical protein IPJ88_16090 [Myxococcales bacterium]